MGIPLEEKAQAYLSAGKVRLRKVLDWYAEAYVSGGELYFVILRGKTQSECNCRAGSYGNKCAHVIAVRMVTELDDMPHEKPKLPAYPEFDKILGIVGGAVDE